MRVYAFVVCVAMVTGCGQSNAVPRAVLPAAHRAAVPPPVHPLLYISDAGNDDVKFYTWPNVKPVATLTGFGAVRGLCGGKTGTVYVVDAQKDEVIRFSHGGKTPAGILYDQGYHPNSCASDPASGRLAVTLTSETGGSGVLAIFSHGAGRPVYYGTATIVTPAYCAFDNKGNLFVDGTDNKGNFALAEMPFGYHSFFPAKVNQTIAVPGGIQWDGTYLVIGDEGAGTSGSTLYQFTIASANVLKLAGTVVLNESSKVAQFWIGQIKMVGPNSGGINARIWTYPGGGAPIRAIGGFKEPIAALVSGGH